MRTPVRTVAGRADTLQSGSRERRLRQVCTSSLTPPCNHRSPVDAGYSRLDLLEMGGRKGTSSPIQGSPAIRNRKTLAVEKGCAKVEFSQDHERQGRNDQQAPVAVTIQERERRFPPRARHELIASSDAVDRPRERAPRWTAGLPFRPSLALRVRFQILSRSTRERASAGENRGSVIQPEHARLQVVQGRDGIAYSSFATRGSGRNRSYRASCLSRESCRAPSSTDYRASCP